MEFISVPQSKVHLISLGCARNRVDSEVMLGTLLGKGWGVTDESDEADAIVINTCGFIQSAKEESIDKILEAAEIKKKNPNTKLVVTGCLPQRYKNQLAQGLPEVDMFIGTDEFPKIAEFLKSTEDGELEKRVHTKRSNYLYNQYIPRINTLTKHSAYVKVAEGCQHNCSFCIIPAIRGPLRSRSIESVVVEVQELVAKGVVEINLIAQDLAAFGREIDQDLLLPLLKKLCQIDGLKWIRLLYMYPENINDEFLDFFAQEDKLVKYLDVPVQHANDRILRSMNRDISRKELRDIFAKVRERIPGIAIRTSVMVGYPGETEEEFLQLVDFISEVKFDHLGCFSYSQEEGTVAGRLPDQIDEETKLRRLHAVMSLQQGISSERLKSYIGQIHKVLVKGLSDETDLLWEGRLSTQAPEVDGIVYLNDGKLQAGQIQDVLITESHDYDLVGRVVSPE
ncbi:MAG: 30S ribosomal protein S12 methylthiotransferase RimO [Bdellovibrionota bacterium]